MNKSTANYMNSLPKPDDAEGWRKRRLEIIAGVIVGAMPELVEAVRKAAEKDSE